MGVWTLFKSSARVSGATPAPRHYPAVAAKRRKGVAECRRRPRRSGSDGALNRPSSQRRRGSAKNAGDAGLMTAWYSAPQSLAPQGASPGGTSGVGGGTGRCPTCPAANARQRGRRAARAPSATSRSRAKGGVSSTAIALRRAVDRAGPTNRSGVQGATGRGARSRAGRRRNPKSCPEPGRRTKAGAPNGWRDRCRRDTPRPPHATAREHASRGCAAIRCGVRTARLAEPDRPAKLTTHAGPAR